MQPALLSHHIFSILQPYKKVIPWNYGSKDKTIYVFPVLCFAVVIEVGGMLQLNYFSLTS